MPSPLLRHCQRAEAELRAFPDDVPVPGLGGGRDGVAFERDRPDLLIGELARRHLPGALLVAQGEVHGQFLGSVIASASEAISLHLLILRGGDCFVGLRPPRNDAVYSAATCEPLPERRKPERPSAMRSLASPLDCRPCMHTSASWTYFCSGMSRITPMAPNSSAASRTALCNV